MAKWDDLKAKLPEIVRNQIEHQRKDYPKAQLVDEKCPSCETEWKGEEIPESHREAFGGRAFFSKALIGDEERTLKCLGCKEIFLVEGR